MSMGTDEKGIDKTITINFTHGHGDYQGSPEDVLRMVADLAEQGYTSGYDPVWSITIDEDQPED